MRHRQNFAIVGLGWLLGACFSPLFEGEGKGAPPISDAGLVVPQPECSEALPCEWGFDCNEGRCEEDALFPWRIETIDQAGHGFLPQALSILEGVPVMTVAPGSDQSRFEVAFRRNEEWRFESLDSHQFFGGAASAVNSDGTLFVAQSDGLGLYLHSRVDGVWASEKLLEGDRAVSFSTSIALDPSGAPHICHIPYWSRQLLYFEPDGATGWRSVVVNEPSQPVAGRCEVFVDRSGTVRIGFGGENSWQIATRQADGSWSMETVDLDADHRLLSFAVRDDGVPFVVKVDAYDVLRPRLEVTWRSGEQWISESVGGLNVADSTYWQTSPVVFDSQGEPYFLLLDSQKASLDLVGRKTGVWSVERVMERSLALNPLLAFDDGDRPHIVFGTYWQLHYAQRR